VQKVILAIFKLIQYLLGINLNCWRRLCECIERSQRLHVQGGSVLFSEWLHITES